jgi:hypothetical protein
MRRTVLALGLLLIFAGFFVLNQGTQTFIPIANLFGLVSYSETANPIVAPTLVAIRPTNYTYVTADLNGGTEVVGTLQVEGGSGIGFYVMNEGNFSEWRMKLPANILLAKPFTVSGNFTLTPSSTGTYFFIFDNPDQVGRVSTFSLSSVQYTPVLNPLIQYVPYELFLLGFVMIIIGAKTGGRPKRREPRGSKCRFCGARIQPEETFCSRCNRSQR